MAGSVQAQACLIEGCGDPATETVKYDQAIVELCAPRAEMAQNDATFEL